jgi:hypothetical protein
VGSRVASRAASTASTLWPKTLADMHLRGVIIGPRCSLTTSDVAEAVVNPPLDVDIIKARTSLALWRWQGTSITTNAGRRQASRLTRASEGSNAYQ